MVLKSKKSSRPALDPARVEKMFGKNLQSSVMFGFYLLFVPFFRMYQSQVWKFV